MTKHCRYRHHGVVCSAKASVTLLSYIGPVDVLLDDSIMNSNSYCVRCALDISQRASATFVSNQDFHAGSIRTFSFEVKK